jgi:DNA-binding NarL/FixJ family response regulator
MDQLTPREYQVAMLVARGYSNKQVARFLEISDGTVKLHAHKIMEKLGVKRRYAVMMTMILGEAVTPAE